jgi:hypothetical protein
MPKILIVCGAVGGERAQHSCLALLNGYPLELHGRRVTCTIETVAGFSIVVAADRRRVCSFKEGARGMEGFVAEDLEAGKVAASLHAKAKRKGDVHIAAGSAAMLSWCHGWLLPGSSGCKACHDARCEKQSSTTTRIHTHGLQSLNATSLKFGWLPMLTAMSSNSASIYTGVHMHGCMQVSGFACG